MMYHMDPTTKKVALDATAFVDEESRVQAEQAVALVNRLMADLVVSGRDQPPPPKQNVSTNISVASNKLIANGILMIQQNKPAEATKVFSTALEMILRRPLWEPTPLTIEEVTKVLAPRCDAYIASQQWEDAYADASMLQILQPADAANFYRKAVTLLSASKVKEARELLVTALSIAPGNSIFRKALESIDKKTP